MNHKKKDYRTPIIRLVKFDTGNILADSNFPDEMDMYFENNGTNSN